MPQRIQRKRTKGWSTPLCSCGCGQKAIYVGRPGPWRNPFKAAAVYDRVMWSSKTMRGLNDMVVRDRAHAVELFREWMDGERAHLDGYNPIPLLAIQNWLRGHDLMCWCPLDQPCHGDVLLELANGGEA